MEHLPILISLGAAFFISIRLLSVSHSDPTTALAIMAEQGYGAVLVSTLLLGLPQLPILVILVTSFFTAQSGKVSREVTLVLLVTFVTGFAITPWPLYLYAIFVAAALTYPYIHEASPPMRRSRLIPIIAINVVGVFLLVAWSDTMWLPREQIDTVAGPSFSAFVLGESDQSLVAMEGSTRYVGLLPKTSIEHRRYCHRGSSDWGYDALSQVTRGKWAGESLFGLLSRRPSPDYPDWVMNGDWRGQLKGR